MLRWPVQLRILLSNVRKFDRIAFYLRTVFLDKVLSAFRVYQQAGNAFFAIDRSSLFHQKLRIIFLNAPIISNGNVAHTLSLCVRALVAAVSRDLAIKEIMIIRYCFRSDLLFHCSALQINTYDAPVFAPPIFLVAKIPDIFHPSIPSVPLQRISFGIASKINSDIKHSSAHSAYQLALRILFLEISFRCGGLSIERNQKPLTPESTLAVTHHDKQKQVEVKRSSRANPHEIRLFSGCPYAVVK